MAQQVAETAEHGLGFAAFLLAHQHHDGAESVEEKVRVQLHLKSAELRGGELLGQLRGMDFELECFALATAGLAVRAEERLESDDDPVAQDASVKIEWQKHPQIFSE